MPDPQCIKIYCQTTMMPKVPQSMGFYYGQAYKQLHCARTARALRLRRPLGDYRIKKRSFGNFDF